MLYKRKVIEKIEDYLFTEDIIVLHGARQVGKTHILYYIKEQLESDAKKTFFIDLEDSRFVDILDKGVSEFVDLLKEEGILSATQKKGEKVFVFIDEIQYLENPSSFLKLIYDHHKNIKLIVSGSSSFEIREKFQDSLVGRTVNFEIFPLSFEEFLLFREYHFESNLYLTHKKKEELRELFFEYVLFGGYPKITLTSSIEKKERYLQQIIDTYIRKDIRDLADIRDIDSFNKLVETLASQSGNLLNVSELSNTCNLSIPTVERYLFLLENTYIIKLVRPFSKNIRSELFKTPKIYFYDSGIAQMLWLKSLQKEVIGNIFETSIFSELIKKYGKDAILFWRTKSGKEIDFIVSKKNTPIPIEAKLHFGQSHSSALKYFGEKYAIDAWYIVGLKGDPSQEKEVYPWAIGGRLES